jgi:SnoaL-like polyketide cyclase
VSSRRRRRSAHFTKLKLKNGGRSSRRRTIGTLPAATGLKMRFTGTTVLRLQNGKIVEEIGLDDGVTALTQLGLLKAA